MPASVLGFVFGGGAVPGDRKLVSRRQRRVSYANWQNCGERSDRGIIGHR